MICHVDSFWNRGKPTRHAGVVVHPYQSRLRQPQDDDCGMRPRQAVAMHGLRSSFSKLKRATTRGCLTVRRQVSALYGNKGVAQLIRQFAVNSATASLDNPALIRRGHHMKNHRHHLAQRPARAAVALGIATLFAAFTVPAHAQYAGDVRVESNEAGWLYDLGAVISIFVDAPLEEPEPVAIGWAPPPCLSRTFRRRRSRMRCGPVAIGPGRATGCGVQAVG